LTLAFLGLAVSHGTSRLASLLALDALLLSTLLASTTLTAVVSTCSLTSRGKGLLGLRIGLSKLQLNLLFSCEDRLRNLASASFANHFDGRRKAYPVTDGDVGIVASGSFGGPHGGTQNATRVTTNDLNGFSALLELLCDEFADVALIKTINIEELLGHTDGRDIEQDTEVSCQTETLVQNSGTINKDNLRHQLGFGGLELIEESYEGDGITERMEAGDEGSINVHFLNRLVNHFEGGERTDYKRSNSEVLLLGDVLVIAHMSATDEAKRLVGSGLSNSLGLALATKKHLRPGIGRSLSGLRSLGFGGLLGSYSQVQRPIIAVSDNNLGLEFLFNSSPFPPLFIILLGALVNLIISPTTTLTTGLSTLLTGLR